MFFDQLEQIPEIIERTNFVIFNLPNTQKLPLKNPITIQPDQTGKISIEKVREIIDFSTTSQKRLFLIEQAETLTEQAQNALLKLLEEPRGNYHFILQTEQSNLLLPTVLSRGQVFFLRQPSQINQPPTASPEIQALAKRLIAATPADLVSVAEQISKHKDQPRLLALSVASTAIELLYKTYFATTNPKFLAKIPKFITLYNNLQHNGHVKLHIVADLC